MSIMFQNGVMKAGVVGKAFSTGSVGYFANGKVEFDGKRYQAQAQLVEIGSKGANKPAPNGETEVVAVLQPKTFSSGKRGYFTNGKYEFDGKRYQMQAQMVEIVADPAKAEIAKLQAQLKAKKAELKAKKSAK